MTQEAISRAELDADQARQETTFTGQVYQVASDLRAEMHEIQSELRDAIHQLRNEMHQMERRIYLVVALATGLIIGAMQIS